MASRSISLPTVKVMVQGLGTEDLLGRVGLAIFDVAAVARGEDEHGAVAEDFHQVVVEVAGVVGAVGHHQRGLALRAEGGGCSSGAGDEAGKEHGGGGAGKRGQRYLLAGAGQGEGALHRRPACGRDKLPGQQSQLYGRSGLAGGRNGRSGLADGRNGRSGLAGRGGRSQGRFVGDGRGRSCCFLC